MSAAPTFWQRTTLISLGLFGIFCFSSLGIWQIQRRAWKLDLITRVEQRLHAAPTAAPGPAQWPTITTHNNEYQRVTLTGQFLNADDTLVQAVTEQGPGFWLLTPLQTPAGYVVLVNRGFLPTDQLKVTHQVTGPTVITGLLRLTEPHGGFLRHNNPAANRWYSRDVQAIAAAHHLTNVAPYFVDADATPNPGGLPLGGLTVITFPNNHLLYAFTWFALAGLSTVMVIKGLKTRPLYQD